MKHYMLPICHNTQSIDLEEFQVLEHKNEDYIDNMIYDTDLMNVNTYLSKETTIELISALIKKVDSWPEDEK